MINPHTLAVLQLQALQTLATSDNAKVVVPYEATSLMGVAEVLLSTLRSENLSLNGQPAEPRNGASGKAKTPPSPPSIQ